MKARTLFRGILVIAAALALSTTAEAQLFRAYLAVNGNDANPCTLPQPCRLLPAALNAVADGGEVWLLDSGNYNTSTVHVTKSVTILAVPGVVGSVVAAYGPAVNVATAGVRLALRNLVMVPLAGTGGVRGIAMTAGTSLSVDGCLISNMPNLGIEVAGPVSVSVTGTTLRDNGSMGIYLHSGPRATITGSTISGHGGFGIYLHGDAASSVTTADIADTTLDGNHIGVSAVAVEATAQVGFTLRDSRLYRNGHGAVAQASVGSASWSASNNVVSYNEYGLVLYFAGTKGWASANTVSGNTWGLYNGAGLLESAGNNAVRNNGTNTVGTITAVAPI